MNYPTWQEVGMSLSAVNLLKRISPSHIPIKLVDQLVFNQVKKTSLTYQCAECGFRHFTFKIYEEYSQCERCESRKICCYAKTSTKKADDDYYGLANKSEEVIEAMKCNYCYYANIPFQLVPHIIDCGWDKDKVYCRFLGGETAKGTLPKFCIIKAALLCPYLWDLTRLKQENPMIGTTFTDILSDLIFRQF